MSHSCRQRSVGWGFLLLFGLTPALRGDGSPPIITDDPGTPGGGHWEINVGVGIERRPGLQVAELPVVELLYGLGETVQLGYGLPWLGQTEDGRPRISGPGKSNGGVKWRFHEDREGGLALSIHPQLEFDTPGSSSPARGLVDAGTVFLLPLQMEQALGPVTLNMELGREFNPSGDRWIFGAAVCHRLHAKCAWALELAGAATPRLNRSRLTVNLAVVLDVSARSSLLFSLGRESHNHDQPGASLIAFAGWQLRL